MMTGARLLFISIFLFSFQISYSLEFAVNWIQDLFRESWFQGDWESNVFDTLGNRQLCQTGTKSCFVYDRSSDIGPQCWFAIDDPNNQCCDENGSFQSPINIQTTGDVVQTQGPLGYDGDNVLNGRLENNGIYPIFVPENEELFPRPTVRGIPTRHGLGYVFNDIHFHFGRRNGTRQTEHMLNGSSFQAEVHLVHHREDFDNLEEASINPEGVAVIAFFLSTTQGDPNDGFNKIFSHLPHILKFQDEENVCAFENMRVGIDNLYRRPQSRGTCRLWSFGYMPSAVNSRVLAGYKVKELQVNPNQLLSSDGQYFNYEGGLTNPPCSESVVWLVAGKPVRVTPLVISLFSQVESRLHGQKISDFGNLRPLQNIRGRKIRKLQFTV